MMEVIVNIFNKKVGTLYDDEGVIYFEYDRLFSEKKLDISPIKLPLNSTTYTNRDSKYFETLAGVFFDSLPDKFGTKVIERYYESKKIPVKDLTTLHKLIFIGKRGMGALEYEPSEPIVDDDALHETLEIKSMYEASRKIIKGEPTEAIKEMLLFMDSGASAGGARAKAVIGWDRHSDKMVSGAGELEPNYEYWLVKFDEYDDHGNATDFTKLEYLYMQMAKECGINTPELALIKSDDLTHFAIKRFDRKDGKKIHMHSLASMVHVNFNEPLHYSYDEALRVVRYITKDKQAVEEFYKRAVFNVIARNQDDHAKNTSFLMEDDGKWYLSPSYDITYANGQGFTRNHQMSILGKVNDFSYEDLMELAKQAEINSVKATRIIEQTIDVLSHFKERAQKLNMRKELVDLVYGDLRIGLR